MEQGYLEAERRSFIIGIIKEIDGRLLILRQNKRKQEDTPLHEFLAERQKKRQGNDAYEGQKKNEVLEFHGGSMKSMGRFGATVFIWTDLSL